ncbi:MAG: Short-chain dehydrogenase, associated with 2-hydroxychromene-2-carboxylate isomerase family protein [Candidatus Binatus sp.]|jgi:NADP-dependent 3-hydroxy acid dehydrogenase YdfG|nr:Short-chain dehydrogenase, associated with 2-hydroxychromene-2-carboxylate isomerase family protein [Candidatus Binatus sp.]
MANPNSRPVCVVIGVGPGLGAALARRFAAEYSVALVARGEDKLSALAKEIEQAGGHAIPVSTDVAKAADIKAAFERIRGELGEVDTLLYNASMRPFGKLMETKPSTFENTWRVATFGAFLAAQEVVPGMLKKGSGAIIFTGATAGIKPYPTSAAFGPAKFALRGLAQVMARDLQPQGIHVAYVNVDGAIDTSFIRERFPSLREDDMLKPSAIAETYWHLAHQDRSAWSHDVDVRPYKEKW